MRRAERHDRLSFEEAEALRRAIKARVADLLDAWESLANYNDAHNTALQYGREIGGAQPLLRQPTDPAPGNQPESANKFRAARSLRDVEPTVHLWLRLPGGSRGPEMTDAESEER